MIEVEGARLAKLVDDLLDLSKIEAGAVAPQADWCDLHDVVGSAAAQVRTEHPIEFALPADLPLVRADASQLERVFSNLIENAVKFSPPHAPVRITAGVGAGTRDGPGDRPGRGIPSQQRSQRVRAVLPRPRRRRGVGVRSRARDLPRLRRGQRRADRPAVAAPTAAPRSRSASRSSRSRSTSDERDPPAPCSSSMTSRRSCAA